jgi:hypothetical protein
LKTSAAIVVRPSEASRRAVAPRRAARLRSLVRKKSATPIASINNSAHSVRGGNEKSEKAEKSDKKASGLTDGSG